MNELGHILREARETRGLSLAEVAGETRINPRFLAALENGEYATLPTQVHVRGFLRNYARFLGLDPQPLLDRYEINKDQVQTAVSSSVIINEPEVTPERPLQNQNDQPFFEPVNMEVNANGSRSSDSVVRVVIIVALLATLYLVGSQFLPRLFGNNDNQEALTESINTIWQDIVNNEAQPTVDPAATPNLSLEPSSVLTSTSRNINVPTAVATRPTLPGTLDEINLKIDVTERSFMEVTIDGDVVFSGNAIKGDSFEWQALEEAKLLTGNAIGLVVTINEIELGRLGERGESKEEIWRTTQ